MNQPPRLATEFLASAPDLERCPSGDEPEVALAGRSNAGKSSVLNRLTGNRRTARVSKTPGRTRLINFFQVAGGGRLVDLPGYGYASAGRREQQRWQRAVNEFLSFRNQLAGVVLVTDIRHPGTPFDVELIDWAAASDIPLHVLLNKADKLKSGARRQALTGYRQQYTGHISVQLFSAANGLGVEELLAVLDGWLQGDGSPQAQSLD
ncbi:MAG: ribosome biogenesis GTP-binding protein YihA/YsxC [Gammaproteobacteria bacterium]|nr:ribosome biogenesis GTP-binding protein YihA/YsxC [Gammaproteobacteria bacterium]